MLALLPTGPFHVVDHRRSQSNNSTCSTNTITASNPSSPASTLSLSNTTSPAMENTLVSALRDRPPLSAVEMSMSMRRPPMHSSYSSPSVPTVRAQTPQPNITPYFDRPMSPILPPAPNVQHPLLTKHSRRSVVSMATEQEILDLAGILGPAVDSRQIDTPLDRAWARAPSPSALRHKISLESNAPSLASISTVSTQSIDTSEYGDSLYLSPTSSQHSPYHLLARRQHRSDTPSLAASGSGSDSHSTVSLATPPLSRAPSFQQSVATSTPPLSPSSSSLAAPIELGISGLGLDVIHEQRHSEEADGSVLGTSANADAGPSATAGTTITVAPAIPHGRASINTTRTTTSTGTGTSSSTGTSSATSASASTSSSKRSEGAKSKESATSSRSSSSKDRDHASKDHKNGTKDHRLTAKDKGKDRADKAERDREHREREAKSKKLNAALTQSAAMGPFMMSNDMSWLTLGPEELAKLGIHPEISDDGPVGNKHAAEPHKRSAFGRLFHKGGKGAD